MEDNSFIILDTTPSLMEPYSLLEMPESMSLDIGNVPSAAKTVRAATIPEDPIKEKQLAAMKSLWATSLMHQSTEIPTSIRTQTENVAHEDTVASAAEIEANIPLASETAEACVQSAAINENANSVAEVQSISGVSSFVSVNDVSNSLPPKSTMEKYIEQSMTMLSLSAIPKEKLAESFLLGNIDNATMKSNFHSLFPSLMKSIHHDDVPVEEITEAPIREVKKCQNEIEELNKQNVDLQGKLVELHQLIESQQIARMAESERDTTDSAAHTAAAVAEMQNKYEQEIQTLQLELSKAIGESLEFEDMKKSYINEMDCLKVNLVATEELYKESVADQNILKSRNAFLSQEINDNKKQIISMQSEIGLLKAQLEQYQKDFESEKTAREEIAQAREQWLSDLQMLQQRNRELMSMADGAASAQPRNENPSAAQPSNESRAPAKHICPICNCTLRTYDLLEIHVDRCLEQAQFD